MKVSGKKILIKAAKLESGWVPIWEFKYEHSEMYGSTYIHKDSRFGREKFSDNFQDAYYDLNTKEITAGTRIEHISETEKYKVGDEILVESKHHVLKRAKISELIHVPDRNNVLWGWRAKKEYGNWIKYDFKPEELYEIVFMEQRYKIEGSEEIIWPHMIYSLES
jgi:hypothetical protein